VILTFCHKRGQVTRDCLNLSLRAGERS
jgi:hypothetical protein